MADIRAGRLPSVTWVTPRFEVSDHPHYSLCHGDNWTAEVVNAVMDSPMWKDTAIFITWDEWGGFYDHVPPPSVRGEGLGFRVRLLVLSPYALAGHIDHRLSEFSTVLRFIEDNWKLAQLTHRDRPPRNLSYDFDFSRRPRPPDPQPLRTDCHGPAFTSRCAIAEGDPLARARRRVPAAPARRLRVTESPADAGRGDRQAEPAATRAGLAARGGGGLLRRSRFRLGGGRGREDAR